MYRAYICESCQKPSKYSQDIWECPSCKKDACQYCFWIYAHHKECSEGKTEEELIKTAEESGFDFS